MDIKIREMQQQDVDAVTALEESCFSMPWKRHDFEEILKSCLVYDDIIFISDSTLNFVSIDTVKIIQRLFPLVTIFSFYDNGKIRHIPRYKKTNNCFLLYQGELNKTLLKDWFNLCTNHLGFTAKGVFSIHDEEIYRCILQ